MTSMPMTKYHLRFALALQKQGLVSTVDLGGKQAPPPPTPPSPESRFELAEKLKETPWDAYPDPSQRETADRDEIEIPTNPAQQRIWVGLKYWKNEPLITKIQMVSKPSKRVKLELEDLDKIVRGKKSSFVEGLTRPGECLFLFTKRGLLEAREAMEKRTGGMALCRVW
jgi:ribosomal protein S8